MFTKKSEQEFFFSHLNKNQKVLEYGSGESTIEISEKVDFLLSIEHQEEWYNKLINILPNNVKLILKKASPLYTTGCGTYEQFKEYVDEPLNHNKIFDVILIDGRARIACSKFVKNVSNEETLIFVHDFTSRMEEHNYKEMLNYLELIKSVDDISLFKIKK